MIKHIVMWKLKESVEGVDKAVNLRRMKKLLESLPEKIPQIREFEVGVNTIPSDAAWDISLVSGFDSKEDLDSYQKHPEHVAVAQFIGKIRESRALVDYEL